MSEHKNTPAPAPAAVANPRPQLAGTPNTPGGEFPARDDPAFNPAPATSPDVHKDLSKDQKQIDKLQAEYDVLKREVEAGAAGLTYGAPVTAEYAEKRARKLAVTREIDALKRKHDLP